MNGIGAKYVVGIGQADEFALVMGKIEIILPEWIADPVGYTDESWAVDVALNTVV